MERGRRSIGFCFAGGTPFSARSISLTPSQVAMTASGVVAETEPNTCGCRRISLRLTPSNTSSMRKAPFSSAICACMAIEQEQVAKLFGEPSRHRRRRWRPPTSYASSSTGCAASRASVPGPRDSHQGRAGEPRYGSSVSGDRTASSDRERGTHRLVRWSTSADRARGVEFP